MKLLAGVLENQFNEVACKFGGVEKGTSEQKLAGTDN
jgi:hypothetical protein